MNQTNQQLFAARSPAVKTWDCLQVCCKNFKIFQLVLTHLPPDFARVSDPPGSYVFFADFLTLGHWSVAQLVSIEETTGGRKTRWTVP